MRARLSLLAIAAVIVLASAAAPAHAEEAAFPSPEVRAWQTGMLRADRIQHATLAMTGSLSIGLITREPMAAFGGAFAMGLLKEFLDADRDRFDWLDLTADALGGGGSALITGAIAR